MAAASPQDFSPGFPKFRNVRMPLLLFSQVGDSVVRKARETLENAIKMVNENEEWRSRVIYGDTDRWAASLFSLYWSGDQRI